MENDVVSPKLLTEPPYAGTELQC